MRQILHSRFIEVAGLIVLALFFTLFAWVVSYSVSAADERRQFEISVSKAQACALVGVLTVPEHERTQEAAQVIVNRCYSDAGVGDEAPAVPEEPEP